MKRTTIPKVKVKKRDSLESESDRSLSPNDVSNAKENKPNLHPAQQIVKKSHGSVKVREVRAHEVRTGIVKPNSVSRSASKIGTPTKPSPVKQSCNTPVKQTRGGNTRLQTPKSSSATSRPSIRDKDLKVASVRSPRVSADQPRPESPAWKVPHVANPIGKSTPVRTLPGRGGPRGTPRKPKKVYNPPSLFSLCKTALTPLIPEPEVDVEAKDFLKRRLYSQALLGTIWDILTKETKSNRVTKENLITERDGLSCELSELKTTFNTRIDGLKRNHLEELSTTTTNLITQHANEAKQLRDDYENTISNLREELRTLSLQHAAQLCAIRESHVQEIAALHRDHQFQQNQLVTGHRDALCKLETTQRDLEEQNDYLDSQIKERDENLQAEVNSQVQAQVARFANINAELQSLNDVIDLKSDENKKLKLEVLEYHSKAEDIQIMRQELRGLRDHNEQLQATIDMKTEAERTLNMTQERLHVEIQEKEKVKSSISLKCEELQFKLAMLEEQKLNGGCFTPQKVSTPFGSPRQFASENAISSPKPNGRAKMRLFDPMTAAQEILPLHD